jgi:VWFA-related protein
MTSLIDALIDNDRAALVTFSERLRIHTNLTTDRARLRELVEHTTSGGATAFFDATFAGLALREADQGRTLLLLFSDGIDTASWLTAQRVLEAARRTDVVIYPVTIKPGTPLTGDPSMSPGPMRASQPSTPRARQAQDVLETLASTTGGRVVYADERRPLGETFVAVLSEFRQRYVLSYSPSGVPAAGWHAIEVKLRDRSGQVHARRGYFSSVPTPASPAPSSPAAK